MLQNSFFRRAPYFATCATCVVGITRGNIYEVATISSHELMTCHELARQLGDPYFATCVVGITRGNIYEVATISRLLKIIGLFCRISSLLQGSFAKETYNLKEPTNRSHPI